MENFVVSDAGSVAMMLPEGNINNDQCLGRRLTSMEYNYSGLSQYYPTKKYRSANADPYDAKEGQSVSLAGKRKMRSINATALINGATPGTKVIVSITMNEDILCSYCNSKLVLIVFNRRNDSIANQI